MKRLIVTLLVIVFVFSGCSGPSPERNTAAPQVSEGSTNILLSDASEGTVREDTVFISTAIGWKSVYRYKGMFSEDTELFKTTDGGSTWIKIADSSQESSTLPGGVKSGLTFVNDQKGWFTANAPWEGRVGLFITTDGGVTWSEERLEVPSILKTSQIDVYPPLFFTEKLGILPARPEDKAHSLLYITSDGGSTWQPFLDHKQDQYEGITWVLSEGILSAEYAGHSWGYSIMSGGKWSSHS